MSDLVDFVHARITEDEACAVAAGGRDTHEGAGQWTRRCGHLNNDATAPLPPGHDNCCVVDGDITIYDEGGHTPEQADHIARWDPARGLAECEAKRRIVAWCVEVVGDRDLSNYGEVGCLRDDRDALAVTLAVETLRLLALPYAGHPDYREEWRP